MYRVYGDRVELGRDQKEVALPRLIEGHARTKSMRSVFAGGTRDHSNFRGAWGQSAINVMHTRTQSQEESRPSRKFGTMILRRNISPEKPMDRERTMSSTATGWFGSPYSVERTMMMRERETLRNIQESR